MSSRTVSVVLTAQVQNYLSNMRSAEERTREVERAARTATEQFRAHNEALSKVGVGMLAVGGAAALGLGVAIKASTEYGGKLAQLQALSHASAGEMQRLSDAAMKQGQAFGYSATQVADAEIELTKAGRSTAQMLGGDLKGALALAAAGQLDVAEATSIGVTAITQFAASGATIPHTADLLAAGADKALGSVQELGMALKQGGLVSAQMGLSLDDTVGTLSAFAQAGLIGSDAGTSFKTMLLSLQSPSSQAQKYLDKYNITAYDSKGAFVGITNLAGQLSEKLSGKNGVSQAARDAALSTIFGTDAIRAANVLYKEGSTGIGKWIHDVNETGFASAQAAGKLNSLQGDLQKLSAAWQTDLIKAGGSADGFLRGRVQSITAFVTELGDMPAPLQAGAVAATAVAGSVALMGGALLVAVPKIAAARTQLQELGVTGRGAAAFIGKGSALLLGVTSLVSAFAALAEHGTAGEEQIKKTGASIRQGWAGLDAQFGKAGTSVFSGSGLKSSLDELKSGAGDIAKFFDGATLGIAHFADVYKGNEATFDAIGQQLAGLAEQDYSRAATSFGTLVEKYHLGAAEQAQLLQEMPAYRDELAHLATQAGVSTSAQSLLNLAQNKGAGAAKVLAVAQANAAVGGEKNAAALAVLGGSADEATSSVDDLIAAIEGLDRGHLSARAAARGYQKALDDATAALKKNGQTANQAGTDLDTTTQKGRDNADALDGIATSAERSASAYVKAGGSAAGAQKIIDDGRKAYEDTARAMGISRTAAHNLANELLGIPGSVNPAIRLAGIEAAKAQLAELGTKLDALHGRTLTVKLAAEIDMTNSQIRLAQMAASGTDYFGNPIHRAGGGDIPGIDHGRDEVRVLARPGEHMLTVDDVKAMGGQGGVYAFRNSLHMAEGGAVGDAATAIRKYGDQYTGYQRHLASAKRADKAAQKRYRDAQDRAANISGKGTAAAKHRATLEVRARKKAADAASKQVDDLQKRLDDAKQHLDDAKTTKTALTQDREDFVSAERRSPDRRDADPLAYVDQLRGMSRDDNFSAKRRSAFDTAANKYEGDLVRLAAASEKAAKKLDDLQQSSEQLRSSVRGSVAGSYTLAGAAQQTSASGWVVRDGIRYQTTSSSPTAGSIAAYYQAGGGTAGQFTSALQQLAARGVNTGILAELAGMGTVQGLPIAQALLAGSATDIAATNAGYSAIGAAADLAGSTVADATYAAQIAAADRNAKDIQATITDDGEKLRKLIASAFGLKGYAVGTDWATAGVHLVGEHGPELVGFRGGEKVLRAADSARWIRGVAGAGAGGGQVITLHVAMPRSIDLVDAGGQLISTVQTVARDVAVQEIHADALHDAVLMSGGAA